MSTTCSQQDSLFIPEKQPNGAWRFKSFNNGYYLYLCSTCVPGPTPIFYAFECRLRSPDDIYGDWILDFEFPTGNVTLYTDSTKSYLSACNCGGAEYPWIATLHLNDSSDSWVLWTVEKIGNQVALLAGNGKYLHRCTNCYDLPTLYPDAAFVMGDKPDGASLWTPVRL